jgi:hypothetical protein
VILSLVNEWLREQYKIEASDDTNDAITPIEGAFQDTPVTAPSDP